MVITPTVLTQDIDVVFLDRDGCINHNNSSKIGGPYWTTKPWDFDWMPNTLEAMSLILNVAKIHVVTMQNCIVLGYAHRHDVDVVNEYMTSTIKSKCGLSISSVEVCCVDTERYPASYTKEERRIDEECKVDSKARAIQRVIEKWNYDPAKCMMVGDSLHDIIAGIKAGVGATCRLHTRIDDQLIMDMCLETCNGLNATCYAAPNLYVLSKHLFHRMKDV